MKTPMPVNGDERLWIGHFAYRDMRDVALVWRSARSYNENMRGVYEHFTIPVCGTAVRLGIAVDE
ncbi:MAG: hypothetical protein ACM3XO_09940 [Bacteroidota bacterium]